jgi:virulence-associated protein VapD
LTFDKGKSKYQTFDINYKDIKAKLAEHGFDQSMNYAITFDIPAKYLGSDINNLICKTNSNRSQKKLDNIQRYLTISFSQPKITTDLKEAT